MMTQTTITAPDGYQIDHVALKTIKLNSYQSNMNYHKVGKNWVRLKVNILKLIQ